MAHKSSKKLIEKITEIAQGLGWYVTVYEKEGEIEFRKFSEAGQDFGFTVSINNIRSEISDYIYYFDIDEQTMLWVDENGHGINGAPYHLLDIIADVTQCKNMVSELYTTIDKELSAVVSK